MKLLIIVSVSLLFLSSCVSTSNQSGNISNATTDVCTSWIKDVGGYDCAQWVRRQAGRTYTAPITGDVCIRWIKDVGGYDCAQWVQRRIGTRTTQY